MSNAGAPTKYKPEYCQAIKEHMAHGASMTSFAASIDVSRSVLNEWMEEHPEFLQAVKVAKAKCAAWWEDQGRLITTEGGGSGSATMAIFGLKNMSPDDWREKTEHDLKSSDGSMSPTRIEIVSADDNGED